MKDGAPRMSSVLAADLMLAVVALIWGAGIPLSAVLARGLTPLWAIALRMLLAAFFLIIMFRRTIMSSTARDWKISFLLTAVLAAVFTSMTFGLVYSTARPLQYSASWPVSVNVQLSTVRTLVVLGLVARITSFTWPSFTRSR